MDCRAAESLVQPIAVEALDVRGVELLEPQPAENRLDVIVDKVGVSVVRATSDGAVHRSLEPSVEVLADGQVLVVVHNPIDAIGHGFSEFVLGLCSRLAIENLALCPIHGLDVVAGLPTPVLAAGDRTLTVTAPTHNLHSLHKF